MPKTTLFVLSIPLELKSYFEEDYNDFFNDVIIPKIGSFNLLESIEKIRKFRSILTFEVNKKPFGKSYSNLKELCKLFKDYAIEYYKGKFNRDDLTCSAYNF